MQRGFNVGRVRGASVGVWLGVIASALSGRAETPRMEQDPQRQAGDTAQLRESMRALIESARDRVFPALVNIDVVTVNYWGGQEHKGRSTGSGTIISQDGYVVTNQHVTSHGHKFRCTLSDKQEIDAEMVGEDPLTDLAVLKLDLSQRKGGTGAPPIAAFGDSDTLHVGDYVMAMGSPFALSRSVTLGIVSNTERVFAGGGGDEDEMELEAGQRTGLFTKWVQHDALINPGNSGGPLVNLRGEVVGVNELGSSSIGFAIPSNLAQIVVKALIEHGEVERSWVGVSLKPIQKTGLEEGVLVNSVVQDGPADEAGIRAGDVILSVSGTTTTVRFPEEIPPLLKRIAHTPIGTDLEILYRRDGQTTVAMVKTEKLEKDRGDETALRAWGITVEEITDKMAREARWDSTEGVMVSSLRSGGPAALAEPALAYGDIIRSIDRQPIKDLPGVVARYKEIMAMEPIPEYMLVEFDRSGKVHLTLVKPKPEEEEEPPRELPKAWVGVATQPVLEKLAKQLGNPEALGFRITRVYPRTGAAKADLKVGDIITELNGKAVRPSGMQDAGLLGREIRRLEIDDDAELTVLRGTEFKKVKVVLERTRITPSEAHREKNRDFDLTVREVTFFDRDDNRWDNSVKGVLVEQVEEAGWAGLGGIEDDDLIQKINGRSIKGLKGYRKAMEAVAKEQPERVVFVVLRGVQTRFQFVEPEWKPLEEDKDGKKDQGD